MLILLHLTSVKSWAGSVSNMWKDRLLSEGKVSELSHGGGGVSSEGNNSADVAYTLPGPFPSGVHILNHLILTTACV